MLTLITDARAQTHTLESVTPSFSFHEAHYLPTTFCWPDGKIVKPHGNQAADSWRCLLTSIFT